MSATQGCIVADPPAYQEPVQTAPLLELYKASPPTASVVVWTKGSPSISFIVPFRSEDAGEDLQAYAFEDYGTPVARPVGNQRYAASTYDDPRVISIPWRPDATEQGCHLLTIVVAHLGTFLRKDGFALDPEKAGDDAAIVNWWVNINPDGVADNTLVNCPQTAQPGP